MSAKQLPPPAGGSDLTALLRRRHQTQAPDSEQPAAAEPTPAAEPAPGAAASSSTRPASSQPASSQAPAAGARSGRTRQPRAMDRRSWYMPRESAEALAAAVEDLHWQTRRPKHEVLAAIVAVALAHLDDVPAELNDEPPHP